MPKKIARQSSSNSKEKKKKAFNRTNLLYLGSVVILVIIVVTFIGGPIASSQVDTGISFGSYDGEEIRYTQGSYFANTVQYYSDIYGSQFSLDDPNYNLTNSFVWREAFTQTVNFLASLKVADRSSIVVADAHVNKEIIPRFQEDGVFLLERYRSTSNQELFELKQRLSEALRVEQLREDMTSSELLSPKELEYLQQMDSARKSIYVVEFSSESYPDENTIAWATENAADTRRRSFSSITINDTIEEVQRIYDMVVAAPGSFEENARLYSTDEFATQGGLRGETYAFELLELLTEEDLQTLYDDNTLATQAISGIFQLKDLEDAYVFFQANSDGEAFDATNIEQVVDVSAHISENHPELISEYLDDQAAAFIADAQSSTFLEAAYKNSLDYLDLEEIPLAYGSDSLFDSVDTSESPILFTAFRRDDFLGTLFELEEGLVSEPISIRDSIIVFSVYETDTDISNSEALEEEYTTQTNAYRDDQFETYIVNDVLLVDNFQETFDQYIRYEAPAEDPIDDEQEDILNDIDEEAINEQEEILNDTNLDTEEPQ